MSSDLQSTKLESLITFSNGRSSPDRSDGRAFPVYGSNGLIGWANETNSPANSIVIGRVGSYCGSVHFSQSACWVTDNAIRATAKGDNDPSFLYYLLKQLDLNNWRSGSGQPLINQSTLNSIDVTVPAPFSQRLIGSFISSLDDRITLLRETNATLESIAQALFKSWFVDFDPVRAKAEGRQPEGMDATTAALFPDSFEESELGLVPEGWRVMPFTETISVIGGGTPKTSIPEFWNGVIPWFSVVDAPNTSDVFVITTEKHISMEGLRNSSTKLLPVGTTIISARGTVGRLALVGTEMAMNQSCYGLRGKAGDAYFTYFSTYRLVESLKQRAHGSVFDTITRDTLAGVSVIYPSDSLICAFESDIEPLLERIRENLKQAQTLTQLRDTLLPRLISGQLRLPEAQALLNDRDIAQ
jgi:type I restriction enzyme S subunit